MFGEIMEKLLVLEYQPCVFGVMLTIQSSRREKTPGRKNFCRFKFPARRKLSLIIYYRSEVEDGHVTDKGDVKKNQEGSEFFIRHNTLYIMILFLEMVVHLPVPARVSAFLSMFHITIQHQYMTPFTIQLVKNWI